MGHIVAEFADGKRSYQEIADLVGMSASGVKKACHRLGLPRPRCGARYGEKNHQYQTGRRIDQSGYVLVTPPADHPTARKRPGRMARVMPEHRLVMEQKLGRYLKPGEVVDHIDGLTLHNSPENLRLFASNGEHLAQTARGGCAWSANGRKNIGRRTDLGIKILPVDRYGQMKKSGDVRMQQILLAALQLGIDSPYLLGSSRHLDAIGIDPSDRSSLIRELGRIYQQWELGQPPSL